MHGRARFNASRPGYRPVLIAKLRRARSGKHPAGVGCDVEQKFMDWI